MFTKKHWLAAGVYPIGLNSFTLGYGVTLGYAA